MQLAASAPLELGRALALAGQAGCRRHRFGHIVTAGGWALDLCRPGRRRRGYRIAPMSLRLAELAPQVQLVARRRRRAGAIVTQDVVTIDGIRAATGTAAGKVRSTAWAPACTVTRRSPDQT